MKVRSILTIVLAVIALAFQPVSAAESISVRTWFDEPSLYGGQARVRIDGNAQTVYAGQLEATILSSGDVWLTYCTDIGAPLSSGPFTALPLSIAQTSPQLQVPDWAPGGIERATQIYLTYRESVFTPASAVALQALIWESLYDETPSLSDGRFQLIVNGTTAGAFNQANFWVENPSPLVTLNGLESWWTPSTTLGQYRVGQGLLADVPEASTYAALSLIPAIGVVLWLRRRGLQ